MILDLEEIKIRLGQVNMTKMAIELGITNAYLSFLKTGTRANPSYEMLKKISDYLIANTEE